METILMKYKNARDNLNELKALLKEAGDVKGRSISRVGGGSSYRVSSVENDVLYSERLTTKIYNLEFVIRAIEIDIESLPGDLKWVINRRYLDGQSIRKISQELNIGEGAAHTIHKKALQLLNGTTPSYLIKEYSNVFEGIGV